MKTIFLILLAMMFSNVANADETSVIKESLTMSPDQVQEAGANLYVVQYLKKTGFIANEPNFKGDYMNIYYLKRSIEIFNATLVAFDHEYFDEYIGCCASPGVAIVLRKNEKFDPKELNNFCKSNSCTVRDIDFLPKEVAEELSNRQDFRDLILLSCKERDLLERMQANP